MSEAKEVVERLRAMNPWTDMDWPEVRTAALVLMERLEAERDEALKSLEAAKGRLDEIGDYSSGYTTAAGQPLGESIAEEVSEAIGVALAAIRSRSTHA